MADRPTASEITDDQLDALYAERDRARTVAVTLEQDGARLEQHLAAARELLAEQLRLTDALHRHGGAHDRLGPDLACAGCALADRIRRHLDSAQQPEADREVPLCGRTESACGTNYPPCARPAGHRETYCRSKSGTAYFLAQVTGPGRPPC